MLSTSFQLTAALESAASFGTLPARRCVAPLTLLSISKLSPSSLAAPSMMRAEVKYSPVPSEPSTEARSHILRTIGPPGSRTNVAFDEAPPNNARLEVEPCDDHTLRLTLGWLADHSHSSTRTLEWLGEHGGYCDCEVVVGNAFDHWEQNRGLGVQIPDGWVVTYADPSLAGDAWETQGGLLQLHDAGRNRIADLGWYIDYFRVLILQDDFDGEQLSEVRAQDQEAALSALRSLLLRFSS
jgi:hypothetical protein